MSFFNDSRLDQLSEGRWDIGKILPKGVSESSVENVEGSYMFDLKTRIENIDTCKAFSDVINTTNKHVANKLLKNIHVDNVLKNTIRKPHYDDRTIKTFLLQDLQALAKIPGQIFRVYASIGAWVDQATSPLYFIGSGTLKNLPLYFEYITQRALEGINLEFYESNNSHHKDKLFFVTSNTTELAAARVYHMKVFAYTDAKRPTKIYPEQRDLGVTKIQRDIATQKKNHKKITFAENIESDVNPNRRSYDKETKLVIKPKSRGRKATHASQPYRSHRSSIQTNIAEFPDQIAPTLPLLPVNQIDKFRDTAYILTIFVKLAILHARGFSDPVTSLPGKSTATATGSSGLIPIGVDWRTAELAPHIFHANTIAQVAALHAYKMAATAAVHLPGIDNMLLDRGLWTDTAHRRRHADFAKSNSDNDHIHNQNHIIARPHELIIDIKTAIARKRNVADKLAISKRDREIQLLERALVGLEIKYLQLLSENELYRDQQKIDETAFIEPWHRRRNAVLQRIQEAETAERANRDTIHAFQDDVATRGFAEAINAHETAAGTGDYKRMPHPNPFPRPSGINDGTSIA